MQPQPKALGAGLDEHAKRLLALAVAALARREHSRAEIERKLRRRFPGQIRSEQLACVLDRLQARGLLSDTRMAQALVRTRALRYGHARIEQELQRRGVGRDTIEECLPPASEQAAVALALWERKFGHLPADRTERARQGRFLAARGFSGGLISRILDGELRAPDSGARPDS